MIKFSGPAFLSVDNRLMSLQLVESGLANSAMFTADGEVVQAAEVLYKKAILVERGSFRPVTRVNLDMLASAHEDFEKLLKENEATSDAKGDTSAVYSVSALPTMFLIDKKGVIRDVLIGYDPARHAEVEKLLQALLAEPAPPP